MGCCSEPLCCSRSTSANCSFCATWYLLLFLSAVLKICACLNPETHVRHQDIFIFSKLDNLNRTDSLAGLSSRTPHNSNRSQIIQFIQYFPFYSAFPLFPSHTHLQVLSAYLWLFHLRYFHWNPLTLVAFLFRRVSGGECCSCLCAVFSCSLCRQPIVVSPSPKQSCKELLDLPWLTLRLLGVWSLFCEAAWFCLWVAFSFFIFLVVSFLPVLISVPFMY